MSDDKTTRMTAGVGQIYGVPVYLLKQVINIDREVSVIW
jgi:hypothetical protein